MYIVHMIDGLSVGGAQQLLVTFARQASKRNFKLAVVSLSENDHSPYLEELQALGVVVHFFPTNRIVDVPNLYRILKWFLSEKPDILHVHLTYSIIIGSFVRTLTRIPVVATLHLAGRDNRLRFSRTEHAEVLALRFSVASIIACGPAVERYYRAILKNRTILIIPNAIETRRQQLTVSEREMLRKEVAGDATRPIIVSVGRVVLQKGFEDLLDAFAILHRCYPSAFLAIVGAGELVGVLEEKIKELGLSDHVKLLGERRDVIRLLSASDVFALASLWEGLPIAVLEAMATGLPVLTTDVGDNAWAVGNAGLIVAPHEPEQLADAMQAVIGDPSYRLALGQAARTRIEEVFDPATSFRKIIALYDTLIPRLEQAMESL